MRDDCSSEGEGDRDAGWRASLVAKMGERHGHRAAEQVSAAADEFAEERYLEALELLKPVMATLAADLPEVQELCGLIHYRLGHWRIAACHLETFRAQTKSLEQHPVLADCYRGLRYWTKAERLWDEIQRAQLSKTPPPKALLSEARIVAAGALADQGKDSEALALLLDGWKLPKRPKEHHLRHAYAIADHYDREGDAVAARRLFSWIDGKSPGFVDASVRAQSLGG